VLELDIDYSRAVTLGSQNSAHTKQPQQHSHSQFDPELVHPLFSVENWRLCGFSRVAGVQLRPENTWDNPAPTWLFTEQSRLFAIKHSPWVYLIVVNGVLVKIGETSEYLALLNKQGQPLSGTAGCRMGRLGRHQDWQRPNDTDMRIRRELKVYAAQGLVEIWANPIVTGEDSKAVEAEILRNIKHSTGKLPWLNYMCK